MTTAKEKQTIAQSIIILAEAVRSLKDGGRDTQETLDRVKTELSELIATKAASSHTHTIQEITDLMALLDSYVTKDELDSKLDKEAFDTVKAELEQSLAALQNSKADKASFDEFKTAVNDALATIISRDEVHQMIAEAELDDLTLEQVQTEILKAVADKAAKQAVDEANREQDARIDALAEQITKKADSAHTHTWQNITDKPDSYPPSTHQHDMSDIKDLDETLENLRSEVAELKKLEPTGQKGVYEGDGLPIIWTNTYIHNGSNRRLVALMNSSIPQLTKMDMDTYQIIYLDAWQRHSIPLNILDLSLQNRTLDDSKFVITPTQFVEYGYFTKDEYEEAIGKIQIVGNQLVIPPTVSGLLGSVMDKLHSYSSVDLSFIVTHPDVLFSTPLTVHLNFSYDHPPTT